MAVAAGAGRYGRCGPQSMISIEDLVASAAMMVFGREYVGRTYLPSRVAVCVPTEGWSPPRAWSTTSSRL